MTTPKRPRKRASKPARKGGLSAEMTAAIAGALDKKAEQMTVLDLTKSSAFTDFFVICTGTNRRQVQANVEFFPWADAYHLVVTVRLCFVGFDGTSAAELYNLTV